MNAIVWFYAQGFSVSAETQATAAGQGQPKVMIDESWNGHEWISRKLVWDGEKYVPEVKS